MCIIVSESGKVFCGWDLFGQQKFVTDRKLGLTMRYPLAEKELPKIIANLNEDCKIVSV